MKVAIFPRLLTKDNPYGNPYIQDFVKALELYGITVSNPPHKNPLLSILPIKTTCDAYIFHWIEDIPSTKYGSLQTFTALGLILWAKSKKRKIAWFLHNKRPHDTGHERTKNFVAHFMMKHADLIITHAQEGIEVIRNQYPPALTRTIFLHHPTKNRINNHNIPFTIENDLLIWGTITRYKGITELVLFAVQHHWNLRIKIIGRCVSKELQKDLEQTIKGHPHITFESHSIPFEELETEIRKARFVLVPYAPETILSSGILMDSLSFGAQVIGPNVGSFKDYAQEPLINVFTFNSFSDIPSIVNKANKPLDINNYKEFLNNHDWNAFGKNFSQLIQQ